MHNVSLLFWVDSNKEFLQIRKIYYTYLYDQKWQSILKVPYCTHFWSFILGVDVLKNIYLWYKYQNLNIFVQLFSQELKTDWFVLSN